MDLAFLLAFIISLILSFANEKTAFIGLISGSITILSLTITIALS